MACPKCESDFYGRHDVRDFNVSGDLISLYFNCICDECGCRFIEEAEFQSTDWNRYLTVEEFDEATRLY